ncbi:MAG: molybdenum cofactor biosynthesis protein MoaE [Halobacteriovoraceae bacterium]|nr:molybdenum cofactor biosynthesis protein MoaE [Halobacteriovoraceae bacterium]
MFLIHEQEIESIKNQFAYNNDDSGGIVTFEGRVRNINNGHQVTSLEYESYKEMASKEGEIIINEALSQYELHSAFCVHRIGHLNLKDLAVWIHVASRHRKEAFRACQYIIDNVKSRVPIWKREYYIDQDPVWVACHGCQEHTHHGH